jgi:hypothetical protein
MMTPRLTSIRFALCALLFGAGAVLDAAASEKLDARLRSISRRAATGGALRPQDVSVRGSVVYVPVFIQVRAGVTKRLLSARYPQARLSGVHGSIITGRIPVSLLATLAGDPDVVRAEAGTLQKQLLDIVKSSASSAGVLLGSVDAGSTNFGGRDGSGVIIGIVDSGIDFTHGDFITAGNASRILYLWDQTDEGGSPGTLHPDGYSIGTEWTQTQLTDEVDGSPAGLVRQTDTVGHGTHVIGIAAGDGSDTDGGAPAGTFVGIAPDADIIVVKSTLVNSDIADGVRYISDKAAVLGKRAVINLSLGSHSGPHDGTSSYETSVAAVASTVPVIVAMGNEANDSLHVSTTVAPGSQTVFQLTRTGSISSIEAEIWMPSGDFYTVTVTTAINGSGAIAATPGEDVSSSIEGDGVQIFNSPGSHPAGDRSVTVQIDRSPNISASDFFVRLERNATGGTGRLDGWITTFSGVNWVNLVDSSGSIAVPATANGVIAVGSYCSKNAWTANDDGGYTDVDCTAGLLGDISPFSSLGPTRDGRVKPDVTGPGQRVASAHSKDNTDEPISNIHQDGKHRLINGTSMAAPMVAGAAALALESDPDMTVEQFRTILSSQARVDAKVLAHGSVPNTMWGYGKATIFGCGETVVSSASAIVPEVVGTSSISYTWSAVGAASSYNLYDAVTLASLGNVGTTNYLRQSLTPNTTYALLVRGVSACGEGPDGVSDSTSTQAILTFAPSFAVFDTSITATFGTLPASPRASSSFGYRLSASTASDFTGTVFSSTTANNQLGVLSVEGLLSFTSYYLRLGTLNETGGINDSPSGQEFTGTSLNPPGAAAFTNLGETQIQANWVQNGNPNGLEYIAQASTASDFSGTLLSSTTFELYALFTGLDVNTAYHFRVRPTTGPFASLGSEETNASPPDVSTPAFTTVDRTSFTAAWVAGGNPSGTVFRAQISRASDFSISPVSSETRNTTALFTNVLPNTTYYLRVAAIGIGGPVSSYSDTRSTSTLTDVPGSAATTFIGSFASSTTVQWTGLPSAPQEASCEGYRVDASTASDFTGALVSAFSPSAAVQSLTVEGLTEDTTYTFRVGALNWQGIPQFVVLGTTKTFGTIGSSDSVRSGQALTLSVSPSVPEIATVRVDIPADSFVAGTTITVNATLGAPLANPSATSANVALLSNLAGVDISAGGVQPKNPVTVVFTYSPAQLPVGISPQSIVIGRLDADFPNWTLLETTLDAGSSRLTARTNHFSIFAPLVVTASANLSKPQIYPVPWKVGTGDERFDDLNLNFTNLAEGTRVRIFTIHGEFLWEATAPSTGILRWDGRNRHGVRTASGTYLAVMEHQGAKIVERVVIVR